MWQTIDKILSKLSANQITICMLLLVILFGSLGHLAGPGVSLLLFYLVPIVVATWYARYDAGIAVALAASLAALWGDVGPAPFTGNYLVVLWNALVRIGGFLIVVTLVDRLRSRLTLEHQLARIDALTGSLNRHAFMEQLQYNLDLAAREKLPFTLAYIDVDNFKKVNDMQGHNGGDRVLRTIAHTLKAFSRRTDLIARLGGDEFAILFPDTALEGAKNFMAKAKKAVDAALRDGEPAVTCSIGVTTFISAPANAAEAIKAADLLMYEVKKSGKNAAAFRSIDPQQTPQSSLREDRLSSAGGRF